MTASADGRLAYLIVLKHLLVAHDLAQAIAEHDPTAHVILARDHAEALGQLELLQERLVLAFLGVGPQHLVGSGLSQRLAARGGRAVLIGEEAEEHGEGPEWWVLERPFTSDNIRSLLHRAGPMAGTAAT